MAGRGNYSQYYQSYGYGHDPFPSDDPEWEGPEGGFTGDIETPSQNQAQSQPTGRGTVWSNTVRGNRSSGAGSGSGFGSSSQAGHQAESSRATYIVPGHPTEQMEIGGPGMIAYPASVAHASRHASRHDWAAQTPQTHDTYPEQHYHEEQYPEERYSDEQYHPGLYHPELYHPEAHEPEPQDLEQQYVAPRPHRRRTHSSGGRRESGRKPNDKRSGCCVIL